MCYEQFICQRTVFFDTTDHCHHNLLISQVTTLILNYRIITILYAFQNVTI